MKFPELKLARDNSNIQIFSLICSPDAVLKVTRSDDGQTLKNQSWNIIIQYSAVHCSGTILLDIKLIIIKMGIKQIIICYFMQLISFAIF